MDQINKPTKSNDQTCGCLIEDLIEKSNEKQIIDFVKIDQMI